MTSNSDKPATPVPGSGRVLPRGARWKAIRWLGNPLMAITGRGPQSLEAEVRRILVVRLDEIGDVVMTTPLLRELRHAYPNAWITLVVKAGVLNLLQSCPYVNEVLTYDFSVPGGMVSLRRLQRALTWATRNLWGRRFDLAISPRWDRDLGDASTLVYFSGARRRIGYSESVTEEKKNSNTGTDSLFTHLLFDDSAKHEVEHNLDFLRFLGKKTGSDNLELWPGLDDQAFAQQLLHDQGVSSDDALIAFCVGATHPKRMWPVARYAALGKWLLREYRSRIVVIGGPQDRDLASQLQQQLGDGALSAAGQLTLRQTAALLACCHLYIGNDTGPMHLAAAAGLPIVEISCHPRDGAAAGSNSPVRFAPWKVAHVVLQPETSASPCLDACAAAEAHCILKVDVDQAVAAVRTLASQQPAFALFARGTAKGAILQDR